MRIITTIGFIGSGAMSTAIALGAVARGMDGGRFSFSAAHLYSAQQLADQVGGTAYRSNVELAEASDYIVLGVKPQVQPAVIAEIAASVERRPGTCLVSIAAGRTTGSIESEFGFPLPVVRVMPNPNAQIGRSVSGVCANTHTGEEHLATVLELFQAVGTTIQIEESDFSIFSALGGCSTGWIFQIAEALARAGVKHGLSKDTAASIVAQALAGSGQLLVELGAEGTTPTDLIDRACSRGGTTIAGLLAAEEAGLSSSLVKAVDAAVARDHELA